MEKSILIIDDEHDLRENIKELLTLHGYKVTSSCSVKEAIDHLNRFIPDLIISDIMMPEINGIEFLDYLKRQREYALIPFIFLSSKSSYEEIRKGMNTGADDYLLKPFKAEDLLKAVESKLNKTETLYNLFNDLKENIVLSVHHELRTPLTPIIGLSGLMVDNYNRLSETEIKEMSSNIKASAEKLYGRIEKFILAANLNVELTEQHLNTSFTNEISNNVEELIRQVASQQSILFERGVDLKIAVQPSRLKINDYFFELCLRELVENAFKYSPPNTEIRITGEIQDDFYFLTVSNSGKGLTRHQIKNIYFFNKDFSQMREGSGLGLPIVKKIIQLFKGELIIKSEPNHSTDITIKLPIAEKSKYNFSEGV